MESITRTVKEMEAGQRRSLEEVIGHELQDDQQVVIRIVTPQAAQDSARREQAVANLLSLAAQGAKHRENLGISEKEAEEILDEAIEHVRRRERR
jgi:hypothetical protein